MECCIISTLWVELVEADIAGQGRYIDPPIM